LPKIRENAKVSSFKVATRS